ncbi:hypothetical protein GA830_10375 [Mesorhizobium sp. NBSH29]|uniref:hypothetical protein n=1 Tax=Mesorhizobium sp. NBSH29 TaxID=2654249 RepID=UPI0018964E7D|nr:hypothetical protein [Mesorhizobium sp. NBSH29]QPC87100.1 hypothetical protein GA830_10375 [Mesorhizobium sp. NBSH29]
MSAFSGFRRQVHADRTIYIVYVLWMIGHSHRTIAAALGMRSKQVAGIIHNSKVYRGRAAMTDDERRQHLEDLRVIRAGDDGQTIDNGALDRIPFKVRPLKARQGRGPLKRKVGL